MLPEVGTPPANEVGNTKKGIAGKVIAGVLLVLVGFFVGRYVFPAVEFGDRPLQFVTVEEGERRLVFEPFWEAWDILHAHYIDVDQLTDERLFYGAVRGMVAATGDAYTAFAEPAATKQFEENLGGSFSGVGIEIGVRGGVLTVIAPLRDSPAEQAGVQAGDSIVAIDGDFITSDMSLDEVVQLIRGERGTTVTLTVVHPGASQTTEVVITRDTIEIESVILTIEDGIAHVIITSFNGDTADRFTKASREIKRANVRGVIIDVRGNPGGFLQSAVDIASRFLDRGKVVVTERGRDERDFTAGGNTLLEDIPTVVLVNGGSASASEILAGALHDQLGVPIIGTTTFGKGSVQEFIKLEDGSSIRVTTARWFTPSGRNIDKDGIEPTIEVEQDFDAEADGQLERARQELAL